MSRPPQALCLRTADGLSLRGERWPGPDPQVLLAHGFGQTRQSWAGTQARLARAGYGSLAMDARGHGDSDRNPASLLYEGSQLVADAALAAGSLPERPVLVGASMGGLTGLMAQALSECFSALVLVDVTPRWEEAGMQRIQAFLRAHPDGFEDFEHAAAEISAYLPHRRERKTRAQLEPLLRREADGRLRWHWDPRMLVEFVDGSRSLQAQIESAAASVRVPVLLVSGGRSDLVSDETVSHFLDLVPQARHVRLPEATHMLAGDDNDGFTDSVLGFLRAHFPPPPPAFAAGAGDRPAYDAVPPGAIR